MMLSLKGLSGGNMLSCKGMNWKGGGRWLDMFYGVLIGTTMTVFLLYSEQIRYYLIERTIEDDDDDEEEEGKIRSRGLTDTTSMKLQECLIKSLSSSIPYALLSSTNLSSTIGEGGSSSSSSNKKSASVIQTGLINDIVTEMWSHIATAGGDMLRDIIEPMFETMLPASMANTKFTEFHLGENPIQLVNVTVNRLSENEEALQFNLDIIWDGFPSVKLKVPMVGNVGVSKVTFKGRLQIIFKPLTNVIPCIDAIQYTFINPPFIDLAFTGLASVVDVSYIKKKVLAIIADVLGGMIVLPYRMVFKMAEEDKYNFLKVYEPPLGILRVKLIKGRNFRVQKFASILTMEDIPDVYCCITFGAPTPAHASSSNAANSTTTPPPPASESNTTSTMGPKFWRSSTIHDDVEPKWDLPVNHTDGKPMMNTVDFLLHDYDQNIKFTAWDEDSGALDPDDFLGECQLTVGQLLLKAAEAAAAAAVTDDELILKNDKQLLVELPLISTSSNNKKRIVYLTIQIEMFDLSTLIPFNGIVALAKKYSLLNGSSSSALSTSLRGKSSWSIFRSDQNMANVPTNDNFLCAGLLNIIILKAHNIQLERDNKEATEASIFVKIKHNNQEYVTFSVYDDLTTPDVNECENPVYDSVFHIPLTKQYMLDNDMEDISQRSAGSSIRSPSRKTSGSIKDIVENNASENYIVLELMNGIDTASAKSLGSIIISKSELMNSQDNTISDKRSIGTKGSSLEFCIILQAVNEHPEDLQLLSAMASNRSIPSIPSIPIPSAMSPNNAAAAAASSSSSSRSNVLEDEKPGKKKGSKIIPRFLFRNKSDDDGEDSINKKHNGSITGKIKTGATSILSSVKKSIPTSPVFHGDTSGNKNFSITIIKGWGFQVQKKKLGKDDIPDCYCRVKLQSANTVDGTDQHQKVKWKTSTIKNNCEPVWKETSPLLIDLNKAGSKSTLCVEVWDEDKGALDPDDFLGSVTITIDELLKMQQEQKGEVTLELHDPRKKPDTNTGCFLSLHCNIMI